MRPKPYIGITGIVSRPQLIAATSVIPNDNDRLIMIGVLASNRTLKGETNKWPKRYPRPDELGNIFTGAPNRLNLIHFNTKEPDRLYNDLKRAQELAGAFCHGFQLNMAWPDKKIIEHYKANTPRGYNTIVLQCGGKALDSVDRNASKLAERLKEYDGLIDYVLVDPSGGLGKEFDVAFMDECLLVLSRLPNLGVGIAGGLHAGNLGNKLRFLFDRQYPEGFSIDAEGQLRDHNDDYNVLKAQAYLHVALELYSKYCRAA